MPDDESFAAKVFLSDFEGIYAQHANIQTAYSESMKMLLTVGSLPLLAAAAYLAANSKEGLYLTRLPPFLTVTLLITPILIRWVLGLVIANRLTTIFYARMLNGIRGVYLKELPEPRRGLLDVLPHDASKPEFLEQGGPINIVVTLTGIVLGSYGGLGVVNMMRALGDLSWTGASWLASVACIGGPLVGVVWMKNLYEEHCSRYGKFEGTSGTTELRAPIVSEGASVVTSTSPSTPSRND